MKEEELNILLDKYYRGETSEQEEQVLKEFFKGDNVPVEYEAEKEIFSQYFIAGKIPEPSAGFEDRIIAGIDDYENKLKPSHLRRIVLYSLSTAAGLIIVAGSYFFLNNNREPEDTFSDPKIAYAETMKILLDVSARLNKGNQALEPINKINNLTTKSFGSINRSTRLIKKSISGVENLDKKTDLIEKE